MRTAPSSDDAHAIVFFQRHEDDDPARRAPGRDALDSYPAGVRAKMRAALVASQPLHRSGSLAAVTGRR